MISTKRDCTTTVKGTGTGGCRTKKKYIVRRFLLQKGFKLDKSIDSLDETKVKELIQKGILVVLPETVGFEPQHKEPTFEEIQKQDMFVSGTVYGWLLKYEADACLSSALASLSSKKWDILEVDEDGELNVCETSDGFIKGFDGNLAMYQGMQDNDGSTAAKLNFKTQLTKTGSIEYQSSWIALPKGEVGWKGLSGIDEVQIEKTASGILVTFACDQTSPVEGLGTANFRVLDNTGAVVPGATFTEVGEGKYTVGGITAGNDYTIYLYDSTAGANVVAVANYYYKSNKLTYSA